ncbi:IS1634 family transposase [Enterococcus camelliae]|uniref:Transposase n=1 Tax=Enterococcus camelliae TaxID=453959 RepID=A0ABW5TJ25_9ENTE
MSQPVQFRLTHHAQCQSARSFINNMLYFARWLTCTCNLSEGEIAETEHLSINETVIESEAMYDGFYAVCTNLEDSVETIVSINHKRWEIEETFRIMKSEFKARLVHLSRDDRIKAHFITCFLSITIFRILEKLLQEEFTTHEIITTLKGMNFNKINGEGFIPTYTRTELTDKLHAQAGFNTDYQLLSQKKKRY